MSKSFSSSDQHAINISAYDRPILALYYILVFIGWLMIYTVNYKPNQPFAILDIETEPGKQFMFIILCSVIFTFISFTSSGSWRILSTAFYAFSILLLILVLFFGSEVNGANAWFRIGGFGFQPAELAKFSTAMAVANITSSSAASLKDRRIRWSVAGIIFLPVFLILLQPDAGSALVFTAFLIPMYREGMNPEYVVALFVVALLSVLAIIFPPGFVSGILFCLAVMYRTSKDRIDFRFILIGTILILLAFWWHQIFPWLAALAHKTDLAPKTGQLTYFVLTLLFAIAGFVVEFFRAKNKTTIRQLNTSYFLLLLGAGLVFLAEFVVFSVLAPHQQERIKVWLRPHECDPRGNLYNILHSKMAISSGGFSGKGFLEGNMTKLKYVPEQNTDFIFCTISEEQGFLGVLATLVLFSFLVYRIIILSERSRSNFTRIYGYSIAGIFMVHFVVNIGMTMGIFPIIGIPLPFMSYGGSSLIGFTILVGVFLKLVRET